MNEMTDILFSGLIPMKIFEFRRQDTDFEGDWEKPYIRELIATLKPNMTVYDIGAENGETSVLAGLIVGGENVHIFEPNKDYHPNIKAIWDANGLAEPRGCFVGYVGENLSNRMDVVQSTYFLNWFKDKKIFYGCYHANPQATPLATVTLDWYSQQMPKPNVVMMDIEGAELSAVRGAKKLIAEYAPIFFISIHRAEHILDRSNGTKEDLIKIFTDNGYDAIHLTTDHEEHWKFIKP